MNILKNLLSYLFEIPIEKINSDINGDLFLVLKKGRLFLTTNEAIYSWEDYYVNFSHALVHTHFITPPKNVLILGLGMGSIINIFEKTLGLKSHFTCVEKDPAIIYLATKHSLPNFHSQITTIETDAWSFMRSNEKKFDCICSDVFINDIIPGEILTRNYLERIRDSLSENGVLWFNTLYRSVDDKKASDKYFEDYFVKVFPNASKLPVLGNLMLVNDTQCV